MSEGVQSGQAQVNLLPELPDSPLHPQSLLSQQVADRFL